MKRIVRVGSRESKLAVIQSQMVMEEIGRNHPDIQLELVTMKTTGDIILDRTLDKVGGKGLFVKELDKALRDGQIDISVHSLKDMPAQVPEDLPLLAFTDRHAPEDVLVMPKGVKEEDMDQSLPIGSSSPRRNLQLKTLFPHMEQKSIRGNVITRLEKLDRGEYACLVLAKAGLERLGLEDRITRVFTPEEMVPAAGQGVIVVQGRQGEDYSYLDCVNREEVRQCILAERGFVGYLEGGCSSPIGAFSQIANGQIIIKGFYSDGQSHKFLVDQIQGPVEESKELALALAEKMKVDFYE